MRSSYGYLPAKSNRIHLELMHPQLPVFITVVMAVRRMVHLPMPGLDDGGLAWFSDLTAPAIGWNSLGVLIPMGTYGIILPLAVTGLMFANINQAFSAPKTGTGHQGL